MITTATDNGTLRRPRSINWRIRRSLPLATYIATFLTIYSYSDYSNLETFTQEGDVDYLDLFDTFEDRYSTVEQDAGYILTESLEDRSLRSGFDRAGWKPDQDNKAQAVEWFKVDYEYAYPPVRFALPVRAEKY